MRKNTTYVSIAVLTVILIAALYIRLDFIHSVTHTFSPDAKNYDAMAEQIIEKRIYAYNDTEPNARVTPGYPMFLVAVYSVANHIWGEPLLMVRYLQIALSLAMIYMIYEITRKLSGYVPALIAAFIAAFYPPFIWANGAILTEVLATFFLMGYVLWQMHVFDVKSELHAFIAGLWLGCSALVRPESLPLVIVLYAFYWFWKREASTGRLLLYSLSGVVLLFIPWWIRNLVTLHEFVLLAHAPNPLLAGTYPDKKYSDWMVPRDGLTQEELALKRIKIGFTEHTWTFIKWYTIGKLQYVYSEMYFGGGHKPMYPVFSLRKEVQMTLIWCGVGSMLAALRRLKHELLIIVLTIAFLTSVRLLYVPEYRYNYSTMPFIIILNCVVIARILQNIRFPRYRKVR